MLLWVILVVVVLSLVTKEGFDCDTCKYRYEPKFSMKNTSIRNTCQPGKYPIDSIDIMTDATFKPECCPTPYSSSSGCLCPTSNDAGLIITRGGNRS